MLAGASVATGLGWCNCRSGRTLRAGGIGMSRPETSVASWRVATDSASDVSWPPKSMPGEVDWYWIGGARTANKRAFAWRRRCRRGNGSGGLRCSVVSLSAASYRSSTCSSSVIGAVVHAGSARGATDRNARRAGINTAGGSPLSS